MLSRSFILLFIQLLAALPYAILGGCSAPAPLMSGNSSVKASAVQEEVISAARKQLGLPYHYGGDTPRQGFDCSGLVYYSYLQAGVQLPRTTYGQLKASRAVSIRQLHPGDLVFFRISHYKISHVGIYLGHDRFIHAPSSGKEVTIDELSDPYWQRRFMRGGRAF